MAANIHATLLEKDPRGREVYDRGLRRFRSNLTVLDADLKRVLAPLTGKTFYVFHPAFGYFADAYGLRQEAIELEGKEPGPRQLAALIRKARRARVRVIFVQRQFPKRAARAVAASIGGAVVALDPLARDYVKGLKAMARSLEAAFAERAVR